MICFAALLFLAGLSGCFLTTEKAENNQNVTNTVVSNKVIPANAIPPPSEKLERDARLQNTADTFLLLFDKMPQVPVYVKNEPIIKTGSDTQRGVAYTICESKNSPTIYVKKAFYEKANDKQLKNILKHELTHAWFCRQGIKTGHDARFRKKFTQVGGFGN